MHSLDLGLILSIESSCDDSSIALTEIETKRLIYHKKISQDSEHTKYGGVVPEIASRLHAIALPKIVEEIKSHLSRVKAVAVTNEPGLSVTLLEGVMMAKALSLSLKVPIISINHLLGHIYSLFIEKDEIFPLSTLLVSGGHTMILEVSKDCSVEIVASSMDDSYGESFDKVAKMLNLGYPGGPYIEKMAKNGDENAIDFPLPLKNKKELAFSFSGLKNAVRLEVLKEDIDSKRVENISASFQNIATKHLLKVCEKYFKNRKIETFSIVGGASANRYLRGKFQNLCKKYEIELLLSDLEFCSDNAAMIGRAALLKYKREEFTHHSDLKANPQNTTL